MSEPTPCPSSDVEVQVSLLSRAESELVAVCPTCGFRFLIHARADRCRIPLHYPPPVEKPPRAERKFITCRSPPGRFHA